MKPIFFILTLLTLAPAEASGAKTPRADLSAFFGAYTLDPASTDRECGGDIVVSQRADESRTLVAETQVGGRSEAVFWAHHPDEKAFVSGGSWFSTVYQKTRTAKTDTGGTVTVYQRQCDGMGYIKSCSGFYVLETMRLDGDTLTWKAHIGGHECRYQRAR